MNSANGNVACCSALILSTLEARKCASSVAEERISSKSACTEAMSTLVSRGLDKNNAVSRRFLRWIQKSLRKILQHLDQHSILSL